MVQGPHGILETGPQANGDTADMNAALIFKGYRVNITLTGTHWETPDGAKFRLMDAAVEHLREAFRGLLDVDPPVWVDTLRCRYCVVMRTGTVDRWYETFAGACRRRDRLAIDHGHVDVAIVPRIELVNGAHMPRRTAQVRKGHARGNVYHRRMARLRRQGAVDRTKRNKSLDTEVSGQ